MTHIKTQIEVNFTYILDFADVYKPIFAPYLKLGELQPEDSDSLSEAVSILFRDEGYSVFCQWNRILFTCDGKPDMIHTHGPLFVCLQIIEKLKQVATFGKIISIVYSQWVFFESQKEGVIIDNFKTQYLTEDFPLIPDGEMESLMISSGFRLKENTIRLQVGVFKPEFDIQSYNLTPISSKEVQSVLIKNGIIAQVLNVQPVNELDPAIFHYIKSMDLINTNLFSKMNV